jgi:hypothetical protein
MDRALENAEAYLSRRGLSLARIEECIDEVMPWETVLFGGSIPEGLANLDSDVDLLLLGDTQVAESDVALPQLQAGDSEVTFKPNLGSMRVTIEVVRPAHLEVLGRRMEEMVSVLLRPDAARFFQGFSEFDLRTMHRVRTGAPLRNPEVAARWRTRLHSDFLPIYTVALMILQHFLHREDAIGEAREGRRESALWSLKIAFGYVAGLLLASVDETNPNPKWRVRLLQLRRDEVGAELADSVVEHLVSPRVDDLEAYFRTLLQLCDTVLEAVAARHPAVFARREEILARSRSLGVVFPA